MYMYFVPKDIPYFIKRKSERKTFFRKLKVKYIINGEIICFNGKSNIIRYRADMTTAHILCATQREANAFARKVIEDEIQLMSHKIKVLEHILK